MDVDARIDALEAERERLQGRIDQLEAAMGMHFMAPLSWRLTGHEARVLGVLLAREIATKDAIMAALYRDTGRDEAEIKIVDVFICKLRKKLKPLGFPVQTSWGQGYFLQAETKEAIQQRIALGLAA